MGAWIMVTLKPTTLVSAVKCSVKGKKSDVILFFLEEVILDSFGTRNNFKSLKRRHSGVGWITTEGEIEGAMKERSLVRLGCWRLAEGEFEGT